MRFALRRAKSIDDSDGLLDLTRGVSASHATGTVPSAPQNIGLAVSAAAGSPWHARGMSPKGLSRSLSRSTSRSMTLPRSMNTSPRLSISGCDDTLASDLLFSDAPGFDYSPGRMSPGSQSPLSRRQHNQFTGSPGLPFAVSVPPPGPGLMGCGSLDSSGDDVGLPAASPKLERLFGVRAASPSMMASASASPLMQHRPMLSHGRPSVGSGSDLRIDTGRTSSPLDAEWEAVSTLTRPSSVMESPTGSGRQQPAGVVPASRPGARPRRSLSVSSTASSVDTAKPLSKIATSFGAAPPSRRRRESAVMDMTVLHGAGRVARGMRQEKGGKRRKDHDKLLIGSVLPCLCCCLS